MPASSSLLELSTKRTLHAFKKRGSRAGDIILDPNNLPGPLHLLGKIVDFKPAMDYAAEQGWVEKLPGGQYRLTDAGFAAAS
jgi:hypothetical protein